MSTWTIGQLLAATQGELVRGCLSDIPSKSQISEGSASQVDLMQPVAGISIDSRRIKPQEAFVAIPGPRFDGHDFIFQAIERGASCLILSAIPAKPLPCPTIYVADTTQALGALASFHRQRMSVPVVAITGSCGKTTTKELIAHLLGQDSVVLKTEGTQNNHIGLPLTLLSLNASHQVAVVELGSNHPGEIAYLARIARPNIALITNIGPAHLEFFGSLIGVLQEKLSLIEAVEPNGCAVLPGDQIDVLLEAKGRRPEGCGLVTFGTSDQCGVQALDIQREPSGFSMTVRGVEGRFFVPLIGSHNVENTLAALACLYAMGINLESVQERLAEFPPVPMRSQLMRYNGLTVINDCYNANPLSFARALETLNELDVKRRVVIAGDMLELGDFSPAAHQAIGRLAAQLGVNLIIAVGTFANEIAKGASEINKSDVVVCKSIEELKTNLGCMIKEGDGLLIKGSRRLKLEQVFDLLKSQCQEQNV